MSSESVVGTRPSYLTSLSRHSRLADVERGKALTRTLDRLSQKQWKTSRCSVQLEEARLPQQDSPAHAQGEELYNPWGSRCWDLDQSLRNSESRLKVILPRRSVVMSRVTSDIPNRQNRTKTNFYSRNGTVRIIEPFTPNPIEENSEQKKVHSNKAVEREETYLMLQRIDQIIHPAKQYFKRDLNSSEVENISTQSTRLLESAKRAAVQKTGKTCGRPETKGERMSDLALVVARLAGSPLDAFEKCRVWVDSRPSLYM